MKLMDEPHRIRNSLPVCLYESTKFCSIDDTDGAEAARYGYSSTMKMILSLVE